MGINSISSRNSMSGMQMAAAGSANPKMKSVQKEISEAKQQLQKLSAKEDLSAAEKSNERKRLQKKISDLNTELEQHREEFLRSQKRESMLAEMRENQKPAKENPSEAETQTDGASLNGTAEKTLPADGQQAVQPGTVIAKTNDGTVIFKGTAAQAENSGVYTEKKQDEKAGVLDAVEETKILDRETTADVTGTGLPGEKMHALVSADASMQLASRQGTIVTDTRDGIAILKGEMKLDEQRGTDTERKQAELKEMRKRERRAMAFQFSMFGEANGTMQSAASPNTAGIKDDTQVITDNNTLHRPQEEAAQRLYVSIT